MLKVNTGPLQGQVFDNLLDYMDAEEDLQRSCPHKNTENREVVTGMRTEQPHLVTGLVCLDCKLVLRSYRKKITHEQGNALRKEITW